ncbi:MAG: hypothetical protein NC098_05090 [Lachnoclostridium sp.]|nr:hypothetical protein [Lachnoclostridium sp.]
MRNLSLLLITLMAILTGCINSDTIDGPVDMTTWDIATFEGNDGQRAAFTVRKGDDSPEVTLVYPREIEMENLKAGDRVYIAYIPVDNIPYRSGEITLKSIARITQGGVEVAPFDPADGWDADPVYVVTIWRTGNFINIYCRLPYYTDPRRFGITADEATVGTACPQLYLNHQLPESINSFDRAYYASFDISDVWQLGTTLGVDLHVNNSNLPTTVYHFSK